MLLTIGATVLGRYEVLDRLAVGGMAEVHLARQVGVGGFERLVALKTLLPDLEGDPQAVARFLEEGKVLARLNHPNVVSVIEVAFEGRSPVLVLEHLDGPSVAQVLQRARATDQRVPFPVVLQLVCDFASGLSHAHRATDAAGEPLRLVHRDVTPRNLLVRRDGVGRVIDFGIAWASARAVSTQPGLVHGTWAYMSPEQRAGAPLDERSDQFSLGVVLWELLTGASVPDQGLAAPSELVPGLPPTLDQVVARMMSEDPSARYPDLAEAVAELMAVFPLLGSEASRLRVAEFVAQLGLEAVRPAPRRAVPRRRGGLWAGVGVVLLAATGGAWWLARRPSEDPSCAQLAQRMARAAERARRADVLAERAPAEDAARFRADAHAARVDLQHLEGLTALRRCPP